MKTLLQEQFLRAFHESWNFEDEDKYSLVGQNGNAFALIGYTARCMKECGLRGEVNEMQERATSGDYNNLICVCDEYVQRCNEIARQGLDEHLISEWDYDEYTDDIIDDYHDGKITRDEYERKSSQLAKMLDESRRRRRPRKLKESMEEIDRKYFTSLNKEEDGHYYILKDGNYVKDFYADSDEEAIKKFRDGLDESLTEAHWNYTLKCGNALRTAIDNGDAEEVINQLWNGYKELLEADIIDDMDYENYTEDLIDSEYWEEDELEDNVDWALDNFYDLCDNVSVWIPLNEHFVTTPEYNSACVDIHKQMVDGKISREEAEKQFRQMDTLLDESHPVTESLWDLVKGYLEEDLHESFNKTEAIKAVQWMYGYSKKRAQQYIKEISEQRVQSIIDAFKNNAKKSFYND